MATLSGRYARVTLAGNVILHLGEWTINVNTDEIDVPEFGTVWRKTEVGSLKWNGSLRGNAADEDPTGQDEIWSKLLSGEKITNIRFYEKYVESPSSDNPAYYYTPDMPDVTGEAVGTGDGSATTFTLDRTPVVEGSEKIYLDGVLQTGGYTIDYTTGTITFDSAPAAGVNITADYEYVDSSIGVVVTAFNKSVAHNGLVTLDVSFSGSGPLKRVKDVG